MARWLVLATALVSACAQDTPAPPSAQPTTTGAEPPAEEPARGAKRQRTVYVPAYSHLRNSTKARTSYAITLSVRNVDPTATITLAHVDYFDTSGHRVRRYLSEPKDLRPLETAEFFVELADDVGGSGANFLVYWEGPSDAHPLLTESIMVGFMGAGYAAFTSRGVELARRPAIPAPGGSATAPVPAPSR